MSNSTKARKHIEKLAEDTLGTFRHVAEAARVALRDWKPPGPEAFAGINTFTSTAIKKLATIFEERRASFQRLAAEPAIARVVTVNEAGERKTYFICRASSEFGLVSYRAPVGRLASVPVGESVSLPVGKVEVVEQARLHPTLLDKEWDSRNSVLEGIDYGPVTVDSFLALLGKVEGVDLLERALAEERELANIRDGLRRSVISKMGLRDQPILDRYQDEIFRLPLTSQLLLLGAPGTGKTTTLIRRLGQKLDVQFLSDDERAVVNASASTNQPLHEESWILFTPTDLLKQYVKEAFAREGIPASDLRIATWSDHRRQLARSALGVLRTPSSRGGFILKDTATTLADAADERTRDLYVDFDNWQRTTFIEDLRTASLELSTHSATAISELGQRLLLIAQRATTESLSSMFVAIGRESPAVQSTISSMKEMTDDRIRGGLNLQLNRNNNFLDDLAQFIDSLQEAPSADDEDQDDDEADEDEDTLQPRTGRAAAAAAFMRAVRAQARALARKRTLGKATRTGRVVEWLGVRSLPEAERANIGASLLVQARARRFANPVRRYLNGIPARYRTFRRIRQSEGKWYTRGSFTPTDIHPLELDVVLLAMLRSAADLLAAPAIARDLDVPIWSALRPIYDQYRNQVLVDEATDFSPVQIACMTALTNPRIKSFFGCGDFNQRLTTWGCRSVEDFTWALPAMERKVIKVSYRHTRQLNELAKAIVNATGGGRDDVVLPDRMDNEGVLPVLLENAPRRDDAIRWLRERIIEIESFVKQLPSIAVLVNSEEEVQQVAEELNTELANENIRVVPCLNGQVIGQDNDVRVVNVQHIKGLEFEAAFFVGVDRLADLHPKLFDKYLYVGITRAATYLGLTCEGRLPGSISALRPLFARDWANT